MLGNESTRKVMTHELTPRNVKVDVIIDGSDCHTCTYLGRLNGCERVTSKIQVDLTAAQVVDNDDIVASVGKIQRRWPSTKTITTKDNNLLGRRSTIFGKESRLADGRSECRNVERNHRGQE